MPKRPTLVEQELHWKQVQSVRASSFRCGYCGDKVSSEKGLEVVSRHGTVQGCCLYFCPECLGPNFFFNGQYPSAPFGFHVNHLPKEIEALYQEARDCTGNNNYTAAVLICRKILMHIGVEQGGKVGEPFIYYVNYLADNGYIPPNGKHWVDHIRKKGNEANHEIVIMTSNDANDLIKFVEMLLRFIYEFPNSIPKLQDTPAKVS